MNIVDKLFAAAKKTDARIVLPEGHDERIHEAARQLVAQKLAKPIVLADPKQVQIKGVEVIDPQEYDDRAGFADTLFQLRKHKGMTLEQAYAQVADPLVFGAMMVRNGEADGCVAGAANATSKVLRAALQVIGVAEGNALVSSTFLMILPDGRALTYADCGMVPNPNAQQLAEIAVTSARTHERLTGEKPIVAMLSFSTKGSAKHEDVTKVQQATQIAKELDSALVIDGELQFDAAFVESVGRRKAPESMVAGRANVFIFPNLDAGNIAYKITERLGNAQAIGPLIQGLAQPMHDLSRGAKAEDIVLASVIAAIQSSR